MIQKIRGKIDGVKISQLQQQDVFGANWKNHVHCLEIKEGGGNYATSLPQSFEESFGGWSVITNPLLKVS